MDNNLEWMAMVQGSLVSRWRGSIEVVCVQERGNKPYRQVEDKLWFKKLEGEGDSATGTQLICRVVQCPKGSLLLPYLVPEMRHGQCTPHPPRFPFLTPHTTEFLRFENGPF